MNRDKLEQEPCDNCKYLDGDGCRLVFEQAEYGEASDECPNDNNVSTKNTVSRETFEQVMWERDIAINQLKELGYGFGEKIEPCDNAVSRQDVLDLAKKGVLVSNGNYESVCKAINELPSVIPQPCEDAIDRAEAIKIASGYCHPANVAKELAKLPSVNPQPCEDAISRQAAIKAITNTSGIRGDALNALYDLPPVNPTKTGHWEKATDKYCYWYKCSCCGTKAPKNEWGSDYFSPYCPECGARMIEPQESEEE